MYYFIELAGSITNIALLSLFMQMALRLFGFAMHRAVRSKSFSELGDT